MAFDIPPDIRKAILPPDSLSPHHLIHFQIPNNTLPIVLSNNPQVFSRTVSHIVNATSATVLWSFHVPQPEDLERLKIIATEGGLTGHVSIEYPTLHSNPLKIPLWVLTFWEELLRTCNGRDEWRSAIEWLRGKYAYRTLKILKDLPWNARLPMCRGCTTLNLAGFCSTDWLSSQHMLT